MIWLGYLYKTTNKGVSFANLTAFPRQTLGNTNPNNNSQYGPKIAIDPVDANVVWIGTGAGFYFTSNGGTSFTTINPSVIPTPTNASIGYAIVYDPTSAVVGGVTQNFYVASYGNGIYYTSNGGSTFTELSEGSYSGTMPTTFRRLVVDRFGVLWITIDTAVANNLWTFTVKSGTAFAANAWTNSTAKASNSGGSLWSIMPDPASTSSASQRVLVADIAGMLNQSINGGSTWAGAHHVFFNLVAADIPWLAKNEPFLTNGNMMFDPSGSNLLRFAEGIGNWWTNPPTVGDGGSWPKWNWNSQTAGIEQLVAVHIISPPGRKSWRDVLGSRLVFNHQSKAISV